MSHEHRLDIDVKAAVVTVSSSRNEKTDLSGEIIRKAFENAGMMVSYTKIVKDDADEIRDAVLDAFITSNCVVITGGTGITKTDCTIEAVEPMYDKKMDGFGELFRKISYDEVKTSVILSRASAGICKGKAIFCIPGSPNAAQVAAEKIIVPEIKHILTHAGQ